MAAPTVPFANNFGLTILNFRKVFRPRVDALQPAFACQLPEFDFWGDVFVSAAIGSWDGPEFDWVGLGDVDNLCDVCLIENHQAAHDLFVAGREAFQLVGRMEAQRERYRATGRQPVSHVLEEIVVALRLATLFAMPANRVVLRKALQELGSRFAAAVPLDSIINWFATNRNLPTAEEMGAWYRGTIDGMREESPAACCS